MIKLQLYYKLQKQLNSFKVYDKLKIEKKIGNIKIILKKLNTRKVTKSMQNLVTLEAVTHTHTHNAFLQNKEGIINLINKVRVGANSTLKVLYKKESIC